MKLRKINGVTLVELMVAFAICAVIFSAILAAFLTVKSVNTFMRHKTQAMEIARSRVERLKRTSFDCIPDDVNCANVTTVSSTVSYDAGKDGSFGTTDDMTGTLTTDLKDGLDMDNDGNTTETAIDVNGDGVNDPADAKPIRVTFTWTEKLYGQTKTFSVFIDTLISA